MSKQTFESNKITATELHDILVMQVQGILGDPELASKSWALASLTCALRKWMPWTSGASPRLTMTSIP